MILFNDFTAKLAYTLTFSLNTGPQETPFCSVFQTDSLGNESSNSGSGLTWYSASDNLRHSVANIMTMMMDITVACGV